MLTWDAVTWRKPPLVGAEKSPVQVVFSKKEALVMPFEDEPWRASVAEFMQHWSRCSGCCIGIEFSRN